MIATHPHPILRTVCTNWPADRPLNEAAVIAAKLLYAHATTRALGVAANQIGFGWRMFSMSRPDGGQPVVVLNPTIEPLDTATDVDLEGCLSLPGRHLLVRRWANITLRGFDPGTGGPLSWTCTGIFARIAQHELDHLDGTLIIDEHVGAAQ